MTLRPPRSTPTVPLFPYTTLFRSAARPPNIAHQHQPRCAWRSRYFGVRQPIASPIRSARPVDLPQASHIEHSWRHLPTFHGPSRHDDALRCPEHSRRTTYRRSEEHTSELQSTIRISYAVFSLKN